MTKATTPTVGLINVILLGSAAIGLPPAIEADCLFEDISIIDVEKGVTEADVTPAS
jgi:hypothetical protein